MSHLSFLDLQGFTRRRLAVAVGLALSAAAATAHADTEEAKTLPKVSVAAAEPEETPKVDRVSSPKFTQDLLDTPQTIAVVSKEVLKQQGATTLSQALRNTPGVTFLLGENGNTATGDSIFMRGFDTQGSIFIDGIRDLGTVTRDTFNTEQVEIAKGPAGPDYGRGAASGYVNMASKVPTAESFTGGTASYGTADNARITGDINHRFEGSGTAAAPQRHGPGRRSRRPRLHRAQGLGRARRRSRSASKATRARYFYLLHTEQDNVPDGGVTTLGLDGFYNRDLDPNPPPTTPPLGPPRAPGVVPAPVDSENYYGYRSDFEEDLGHDVHRAFRARLQRQRVDPQQHALRPARAVLHSHRRQRRDDPEPGSGHVDREPHASEQVPGEHAHDEPDQPHDQRRDRRREPRHHDGRRVHLRRAVQPRHTRLPAWARSCRRTRTTRVSPTQPPGYAPVRNGVFTRGETQTIGAYVFDTLSFAEKWEVTGGFRVDSYDTDFESVALDRHGTQPGAHPDAAQCGRHAVLVQGRRAVQAAAERQHLSIACQFEAASGRRQLHADAAERREQREPHRPRAHRGREPRARHEVGIPRWRAGHHRRHLRQHQQERAGAGRDQSRACSCRWASAR